MEYRVEHEISSDIILKNGDALVVTSITPTKWQRFKLWLGGLFRKRSGPYKLVLSDFVITATGPNPATLESLKYETDDDVLNAEVID